MRMTMEKCDIMGCSQTGGSAAYDVLSAIKQLSTENRIIVSDPTNLTEAFKSLGQKTTDLPFADVGTVQFQVSRNSSPASEAGKGRQ